MDRFEFTDPVQRIVSVSPERLVVLTNGYLVGIDNAGAGNHTPGG